MISVIVVSFNQKQYLRRCIGSIVSQSYKNIEIIVGDDGSNDGSVNELKEIQNEIGEELLHYFVNDRPIDSKDIIPSIRASNIIRKGLSIARGKYVQVIDADDYFNNYTKFEKAIEFLNQNNDFVAYVTGYTRSDDKLEHYIKK